MSSIFRPVYLQTILPDTQKLTRSFDRKIAVVGLTKALADAEAFVSRYPKGWAFTCEALLKLLINPPVLSAGGDDIADADADDPSFGVGFTPLNTCKKPTRDPYPEAADVKAWVGGYLKEADGRNGGRIGGFVRDRLNDQQRGALAAIMS
jgi:exportin-2 (importin alpha re-exporter)